jgi:O-antigen/teichoic acid export membrane protein
MERSSPNVGRVSTLTCAVISGSLALGFFLLATLLGYSIVARTGGAVWVALLSMIVSLPLVTSYFKRRYRGE